MKSTAPLNQTKKTISEVHSALHVSICKKKGNLETSREKQTASHSNKN